MKIKCTALFVMAFLWCVTALATPENKGLKEAAKTQGFFFFYSSACPHCQRFAPLLQTFSQHFGFKVIAVSVDGGFLPAFPDAVVDEGQRRRFSVSVLPSLFLVNPKAESAYLITDGAIDEAELSRRLLKIIQLQQEKGQAV